MSTAFKPRARVERVGIWMDRWRRERAVSALFVAESAVHGLGVGDCPVVADCVRVVEIAGRAERALLAVWRREWVERARASEGAA